MNWTILLLSIWFWVMENNYFGWNALPQSEAELLCDGIVLLIAALAFRKTSVNVEVRRG